jgi:hypothetical protein
VGSVYTSSTLTEGPARHNESITFLAIGQSVSFDLKITIDPATAPGNYIALLIAYSGTGIAHAIPESITVKPADGLDAPIPPRF